MNNARLLQFTKSKNKKKHHPFSKKSALHVSFIASKISNLSYLRPRLAAPLCFLGTLYMFPVAIISATSGAIENRAAKSRLCRRLHCPAHLVAAEENEYAKKQGEATYIATSFAYSAAINKIWLETLQGIGGDAHLEALNNTECLSSLTWVLGDMYLPYAARLEGLQSLALVGGNLHVANKECLKQLPRLRHVGGSVYCNKDELHFGGTEAE